MKISARSQYRLLIGYFDTVFLDLMLFLVTSLTDYLTHFCVMILADYCIWICKDLWFNVLTTFSLRFGHFTITAWSLFNTI